MHVRSAEAAEWLPASIGVPTPPLHSRRPISATLYVTDRLSKTSFLFITGAHLYVYPCSRLRDPRTHSGYGLLADNGTTVRTYGCITLSLDFGLRREFPWRFLVAEVTGPIIGSDFLSFYNLLVDV